jgi:hypothetical protein
LKTFVIGVFQAVLFPVAKIRRLGQARSEPFFALARPTTTAGFAFGGPPRNDAPRL